MSNVCSLQAVTKMTKWTNLSNTVIVRAENFTKIIHRIFTTKRKKVSFIICPEMLIISDLSYPALHALTILVIKSQECY